MADPVLTYAMKGRLVLSRSGWVLLEVPNAIGNGCFKALDEHGIEQPISETTGQYNAHISVIRPDELEPIGGPSAIRTFGKMYGFNLGDVREISNPGTWSEVAKCWVIGAKSPELMDLRRSLGIGEPKYPFHITFAIRKRRAKAATTHLVIRESQIQGRGLFSPSPIEAGEVIEPRFIVKWDDPETGKQHWEQSEFCRYVNHAADPNCTLRKDDADDKYVQLVAIKDIDSNDELTCNYVDATSILGDDVTFTYRGKPYNGESDEELEHQRKNASATDIILRTLAGVR